MRVLIAGDFCLGRTWEQKEIYERECVKETADRIAALTTKHDVSVVNVETVYSDTAEPIAKTGPNLRSPLWTLDILKRMQFNVAACANNHVGDFGEQGVLDTLENLRALGMTTVGAGRDAKDAAQTAFFEKDGMTLALINCCEHEYGYAGKNKAGCAGVDWYETGQQIKAAREKADAVIVYLHGGNEYFSMPRPGMKKLCCHFVDCGAAAVVVCHAHCPQGMEIYEGAPIAYGTGNFYFPTSGGKNETWFYGYMVSLNVEKGAPVEFEIIPYLQNKPEAEINMLEGGEKERFMEYLECISGLMQEEETYEKLTLAWCSMMAENWGKRYLKNATENPTDIGTLCVRNLYVCESHNELIKTYYEAFCDGKIDEGLEKYREMIKLLQNGIIPGGK